MSGNDAQPLTPEAIQAPEAGDQPAVPPADPLDWTEQLELYRDAQVRPCDFKTREARRAWYARTLCFVHEDARATELPSLPRVVDLRVAHNRLKSLEGVSMDVVRLDISFNLFAVPPAQLLRGPRLEYARIEGNPFCTADTPHVLVDKAAVQAWRISVLNPPAVARALRDSPHEVLLCNLMCLPILPVDQIVLLTITDSTIEELPCLPHAQRVQLRNCKLTSVVPDAAHLPVCSHLNLAHNPLKTFPGNILSPSVRSLVMLGCTELLAFEAPPHELTTLYLNDCKALKRIGNVKVTETFVLDGTPLGRTGVENLGAVGACEALAARKSGFCNICLEEEVPAEAFAPMACSHATCITCFAQTTPASCFLGATHCREWHFGASATVRGVVPAGGQRSGMMDGISEIYTEIGRVIAPRPDAIGPAVEEAARQTVGIIYPTDRAQQEQERAQRDEERAQRDRERAQRDQERARRDQERAQWQRERDQREYERTQERVRQIRERANQNRLEGESVHIVNDYETGMSHVTTVHADGRETVEVHSFRTSGPDPAGRLVETFYPLHPAVGLDPIREREARQFQELVRIAERPYIGPTFHAGQTVPLAQTVASYPFADWAQDAGRQAREAGQMAREAGQQAREAGRQAREAGLEAARQGREAARQGREAAQRAWEQVRRGRAWRF